MVVGITANVPESVAPELLWLAGHYSGHPDWAELDENARTGTWAQDVTGEPTVLRAASVIEIRDPS